MHVLNLIKKSEVVKNTPYDKMSTLSVEKIPVVM